jgi:hypothetical protein
MPRQRGRGASGAALTAAFWAVFSSSNAWAQTQPAPATSPTPPPATTSPAPAPATNAEGQASTSTGVSFGAGATTAPAAAPAATDDVNAEDKPDEGTDHEKVVGGLGVGLLSAVELRPLVPGPAYSEQSLVLAILGARFWFTEGLGLEAGIGFNTVHGTRADDVQDREDVSDPTIWGLALHLGVPISLYDDDHYQFLLLPELNMGMAIGRTEDDPNTTGDQAIRQRARLVGGGLRAGAEVQFGMIGLPMLALTGTVGFRLNHHASSVESAEDGVVVTRTRSGFAASTSSFNDPWDLFVSSIAALYYFR